MGDSRRFHEMAKLVGRNFPKHWHIADIAGGKGYLQVALYQLGYHNVTSWDNRKRYAVGRRGYRYGLFNYLTAPDYDAVVAMHPDGGTDHAVMYAAMRRVPAIVCPCCVIPDATAFWEMYNLKNWLNHLTDLAESRNCDVTWVRIPIDGRNDVMIIQPKNS